jgi:mannose-6-phosphate isomerase-like protein (cupin superfamily)
MATLPGTPTKIPRTELPAVAGDKSPKCRVIWPPTKGGWTEPALFEWELSAESWTDLHPHSEYNFVLEGQLFIESGGTTVELNAGDAAHVPAGVVGRYWAPKYARMFSVYGPSKGEATPAPGDQPTAKTS